MPPPKPRAAPLRTTDTPGHIVAEAPSSRSLRRFMVCGAVGTGMTAVGGVVVGPFPHRLPLIGAPVAHLLERGGGRSGAMVAVYVGMALLVGTWLAFGRVIGSGKERDAGAVTRVFVAWALPLAIGPPLFSRDIYSYAAQGRMAALDINPYHHGPAALGSGPFLKAVSPLWASARAPYGPLFEGLSRALSRFAGSNLTATVAYLRALEVVGIILLAMFLPRLAVRHSVRPEHALWLGLLNPLVLFHFVSGGHNDALMAGLLIAGLAVAAEGKPAFGLILCTLAAAIKAPAAAGAVYVGLEWAAPGRLRDIAWHLAAKAAAITCATALLINQLVHLGWGWVSAIPNSGTVKNFLSPMTALGMLVGDASVVLGLSHHSAWAITTFRVVGLVVAALVSLSLFAGSSEATRMGALALSLLALVVFAPVVQPWYVLWGIVLLAAVGPGRLQATTVWISVGLAFLVGPGGSMCADAFVAAFVVATCAVGLGSMGPETLATTNAAHTGRHDDGASDDGELPNRLSPRSALR